jgi:hypothetical protein
MIVNVYSRRKKKEEEKVSVTLARSPGSRLI